MRHLVRTEPAPDHADLHRLDLAWGCKWLVPADGAQTWCASCASTRGRPAIGNLDAIEAWAATEADKRRLLHEVASLGLPIGDDLVFDLVHVPGEPAVTGDLDGVITIDLTERDDSHREHVRRSFGERSRTMLGHLRHELGHHDWPRLVVGDRHQAEFRQLFGDERLDVDRCLAAARDGWRGGAPPAAAQHLPTAGIPRCDAIHAGRRCALEVLVGSTWCASHGSAHTEA